MDQYVSGIGAKQSRNHPQAGGLAGAVRAKEGVEHPGRDPEVEAVIVASWGETHAAYVLAAIRAGKAVFCEKPMATTEADCLAILEAETAFGRRLVQVGFMRRFDAQYRAMKETITALEEQIKTRVTSVENGRKYQNGGGAEVAIPAGASIFEIVLSAPLATQSAPSP